MHSKDEISYIRILHPESVRNLRIVIPQEYPGLRNLNSEIDQISEL